MAADTTPTVYHQDANDFLALFDIDVGAPVLRMWGDNGEVMVTTTRGTFPVDLDTPRH